MNFIIRNRNYVWSGLFAAGGTFFAKLPTSLINLRRNHVWDTGLSTDKKIYTDLIDYLCQLIPIFMMILCNILNWRLFLKALQATKQTVTATVLTAACNYLFTFILGVFIYQESFTYLTVLGITVIIIGLTQLSIKN